MKKTLKSIILILACFTVAEAQQAETRTGTTAGSQASASANKNVDIQSGTHIRGELQKTLDVRKAAVGDRVVLKTTEAIKSEGRKIVNKGAKLFGHVTEVTRKTNSNTASSISILFDSMQDGSLAFPITATISSITRGKNNARFEDDSLFRSESDARAASNSSRATASSTGGLVGGVTSTVGSAVNSSTATVGTVVGATTGAATSAVNVTGNAVGTSTAAVSGSLGRIQISESSSTAAEGSSVLSLTGDNLRLEKGTTFNLVISQSANVGASKQP
jgi:hypothetical protein